MGKPLNQRNWLRIWKQSWVMKSTMKSLTFKTRNMNINEWAKDDQPRNRMIKTGASSLSDAELLAILVGSGNANENAIELMRRVLADCGNNLNTLGKKSFDELCAYKGIGEAKAVAIMAACELGKRRSLQEAEKRMYLATSKDIYDFMHPRMQDLQCEECWIILLNASGRVIDTVRVSSGGLSSTLVDVRVVLREAIIKRTSMLVLCHNHPSGSVRPSREDDMLTSRMQKACQTVNIPLLDHVIVADGKYFSYNDEGKL